MGPVSISPPEGARLTPACTFLGAGRIVTSGKPGAWVEGHGGVTGSSHPPSHPPAPHNPTASVHGCW